MNNAAIITHLQTIHGGGQIDGRTLRSLKRNGYVDSSGLLTAWGFRTLGVYKHIPQLPIVDPTTFRDQRAAITETVYTECRCCDHSYVGASDTFVISVEKLADQYNDYAILVNDYVKEHCWDHNLDEMFARGWAPKGVDKQMLRLAEEKIWFSDFSYTWHILKRLMLDIIEGKKKSYTSTSYKYSITDTADEIRDLIDEGSANYFMEVEVNR
jgi:hypothetical protein